MAVSLSDNAADDTLLRVAGGPAVIEEYVGSLRVSGFQLCDNEAELHRDVKAQYRNWVQPRAAVRLLRLLADHPPLTAEHTALILQWMRDTPRCPNRIKGALPAAIAVFVTDLRADEITRDRVIAQIARAAYDEALR